MKVVIAWREAVMVWLFLSESEFTEFKNEQNSEKT